MVSQLFDELLDDDLKSDPGPRPNDDHADPDSFESRVSYPGPKGSVLGSMGSDLEEDGEADFEAPAALAQVSAPGRQGGGDLFLTCFRLRFEERGSWTQASDLPTEDQQGPDQEKRMAAAAAPELATPKRAPTWKEWSGRQRGNDGFRLDDLVLKPIAPLRRRYGRGTGPAFARCSANAEIHAGGVEALRCDGASTHGIVVTAPLLSVSLRSTDPQGAPQGQGQSSYSVRPSSSRFSSIFSKAAVELYYFELIASRVSSNTTRSVMLGFCWDIPAQGPDPGLWPEFAEQLPRSFVIGGDNVNGWRPVIHVMNDAKIGVLLEVRKDQRSRWSFPGAAGDLTPPMSSKIVIFQDGSKVTEVSQEMPHEDRCPHGIVDLCGNVGKVGLLASITPPE